MKNITIAGNCTKDAEKRTTQSGTGLASFSVAVNGFANGAKTTDFFDVTMFGKRADAVLQFAKKGSKICVTGELGTREYNGKTYLTVNASDFTPMGGGDGGQSSGNDGGYGGAPAGGAGRSDNLDDSDIPFNKEWRI